MLREVDQWTNIFGTALILGLILRYGNAFSEIVKTSSHAFIDIFGVVSLQNQGKTVAQSEATRTT